MEEYKELYHSNTLVLKGYSYVEVLREVVLCVNVDEYSGKCTFAFTQKQVDSYIAVLTKMNEQLTGECLLEDYDFGNTLRLYFNGRKLLIEGHFFNGFHSLTFEGVADQTIILPLISLLK